jgi:hypothetical protein
MTSKMPLFVELDKIIFIAQCKHRQPKATYAINLVGERIGFPEKVWCGECGTYFQEHEHPSEKRRKQIENIKNRKVIKDDE